MPKAPHDLPKGVHRVRRKVVSGVRYHFYAWRAAPNFGKGRIPTLKSPNFSMRFHSAVRV